MPNLSLIQGLGIALVSGCIGFISSLVTSERMFKRKENEELKQRVYEPLRQELASNFHRVWTSDENFLTEQWDRVHGKEYWSFKIKPEKLRKALENLYVYGFHNHKLSIQSSKNKIRNILIKDGRIDSPTPPNESLLNCIVNDLVTYENNLNKIYAHIKFNSHDYDADLETKTYEEYRKEMINIIKNDEQLQDYWEKRKKFAEVIRNLIKQLNEKLGIKDEKFKVI